MLRKILFLSVIVTVLILSMITTEDLYAKSNYELKISSAQIAEKKADGRNWDVFPKSPDPFVKIFIGGDLIFRTSVQTDTYTPSWNEKTNISYKKGVSIRIEVWDKDAMSDDLIGIWEGNDLPGEELSFGQVSELIISVN
jgi:Ca2+-dependent lipid-binding protein